MIKTLTFALLLLVPNVWPARINTPYSIEALAFETLRPPDAESASSDLKNNNLTCTIGEDNLRSSFWSSLISIVTFSWLKRKRQIEPKESDVTKTVPSSDDKHLSNEELQKMREKEDKFFEDCVKKIKINLGVLDPSEEKNLEHSFLPFPLFKKFEPIQRNKPPILTMWSREEMLRMEEVNRRIKEEIRKNRIIDAQQKAALRAEMRETLPSHEDLTHEQNSRS